MYKYLYYKLFCFWLRKNDETANAYMNAIITITFLLYINILSIPLVYLAIFDKEMVKLPMSSAEVKAGIVSLLILLGFMNYILLAYKNKYIKIKEEFKVEKEKKRKKGTFIVVVYLIISLSIPIYIFLFTTP